VNPSGRRPVDLSIFLINLAMQWAEHSFLHELHAAKEREPKPDATDSNRRSRFPPEHPTHDSVPPGSPLYRIR
jgi:hypothetical protein